jgi:predicted nucleic acid-binding protein
VRLYLDSSALVKLVQREAETDALRRFLRQHPADERVTSVLARVEVGRAVLRGGPRAVAHARRQLARLYQVAMDVELLDRAAMLAPGSLLLSLDAIHLAPAQMLDSDFRAVVTYDQRLAGAAAALGMAVAAPA